MEAFSPPINRTLIAHMEKGEYLPTLSLFYSKIDVSDL